jgi:hypothetical protein
LLAVLKNPGSRAAVAMAVQRARRSGLAGDLCRDAAYAGADSGEKREPVGDIDIAVVDSLKVLDPRRPIREADINR